MGRIDLGMGPPYPLETESQDTGPSRDIEGPEAEHGDSFQRAEDSLFQEQPWPARPPMLAPQRIRNEVLDFLRAGGRSLRLFTLEGGAQVNALRQLLRENTVVRADYLREMGIRDHLQRLPSLAVLTGTLERSQYIQVQGPQLAGREVARDLLRAFTGLESIGDGDATRFRRPGSHNHRADINSHVPGGLPSSGFRPEMVSTTAGANPTYLFAYFFMAGHENFLGAVIGDAGLDFSQLDEAASRLARAAAELGTLAGDPQLSDRIWERVGDPGQGQAPVLYEDVWQGHAALEREAVGVAVQRVQQMLRLAGLEIEAHGLFDYQTELALMLFQGSAGLEPTGIVDRTTLHSLERAME